MVAAMALPPDDLTRPLTPAATDRVVVSDEVAWQQVLLERLGTLRTGLALVGLIAVLALGLAAWTFLRDKDDRSSSGRGGRITSADVRALRTRVDDLESRLRDRATRNQVANVRQAQQQLSQRLGQLAKTTSSTPTTTTSGADAQARQTLTQLNTNVGKLNQSVSDLGARVKTLEDTSQSTP